MQRVSLQDGFASNNIANAAVTKNSISISFPDIADSCLRPVEGFPGYYVTAVARVFHGCYCCGTRWRELTTGVGRSEYLRVRLFTADKKVHSVSVHKIVAAAFLPAQPSPAHQIRHFDGNKHNNAASNLLWGTAKENADDRERHGRTSRSRKHSLAVKEGLAAKDCRDEFLRTQGVQI